MLAILAATSPEVIARPIQINSYIKKLKTGAKTLAVFVCDSAGNKLDIRWTNDSDWRAITVAAVANIKAATSR